MTAQIVAVDCVAVLDEAADDVAVPAAVLADAVHERDRRTRRRLGPPALVVELESVRSAESTLCVDHAVSPRCRMSASSLRTVLQLRMVTCA